MFETKTEFLSELKRFGKCIRCKKFSLCREGSQNIRIEKPFPDENSADIILVYGYDFCSSCLNELFEWMDNRNGSNKPVDEKTS